MFFIRLKKGLFRIGENRRATHALLIILILFSTQINECKNAPLETTTNLVQQSRTVANLTSIKLEISQHENTKLISSNDSIAAKSSPIAEWSAILMVIWLPDLKPPLFERWCDYWTKMSVIRMVRTLNDKKTQPCVLNTGLLVVGYSNGFVIQMSINRMVTVSK